MLLPPKNESTTLVLRGFFHYIRFLFRHQRRLQTAIHAASSRQTAVILISLSIPTTNYSLKHIYPLELGLSDIVRTNKISYNKDTGDVHKPRTTISVKSNNKGGEAVTIIPPILLPIFTLPRNRLTTVFRVLFKQHNSATIFFLNQQTPPMANPKKAYHLSFFGFFLCKWRLRSAHTPL